MAEEWKTTDLTTGPLAQECYKYDIPNSGISLESLPLSANTVYEYRAYMGVDGEWYCGDSCLVATSQLPYDVPTVQTGNAVCVGTDCMRVSANTVTDKNNLDISTYGVVYTQNSSNSTSACLTVPKISQEGSGVYGKQVLSDIATGTTFFDGTTCEITGLAENTTTYYRGFALNCCGYGYGRVCNVQTESAPELTVCLTCIGGEIISSHTSAYAYVKLELSRSLVAGENVDICYCNIAAAERGFTLFNPLTSVFAKESTSLIISPANTACVSIPVTKVGSCYDSCSGSITLNSSSSLNDYCFRVCANYSSSRDSGDYVYCATSTLTHITSNCVGTYSLASNRIYACLWNMASAGNPNWCDAGIIDYIPF